VKTKILHLILLLLLTNPFAQAMGYPQDMFAEHVVVKPAAKASDSVINKRKPPTVALRKKKIRESCPAKAADSRPAVCVRSGRGVYEGGLTSSAVLGMTIRMVEKQVKINGVRPNICFTNRPIGRLFAYMKVQLMALLGI
jgi:hypothetical protein